MAEIEQGIFARLSGQTGVTNLVDKKIYAGVAPQGVGLPYITFFKVSESQPHAMIGDPSILRPRIQVSCWSTDYSQIKSIASAIRTALQDYSATTGGITFQRILYEDETNITEVDPDTNKIIYQVAQDYFAWHN